MSRGSSLLACFAAAAVGGAAVPAAIAQDCNAPGTRVESERYVVVWRTAPPKIAVGKHFSVDALVCAKGRGAAPTGLRVDATMPEHRHGMNYRPTVAAKGAGRYVAEGLMFHMPGRWQLVFDVEGQGGTDRLATDILLE